MRLLNIDTLELHEFFESKVPRYAILSHRWEEGEVTFKDVMKRRNLEAPGWKKIKAFCSFVGGIYEKPLTESPRLLNWVWIDTCCIDKRSSAELSEAINSMYSWYAEAAVCYVYLSDFSCKAENSCTHIDLLKAVESRSQWWFVREPLSYPAGDGPTDLSSQWFERGWTLQELIAPKHVLFVDKTWQLFGSKHSMRNRLARITGIDNVGIDLTGPEALSSQTVATKMSWAAKRVCTRPEDVAYSLLGLFRVNMPLLYGEGGKRAFKRLQLEIIKQSDDESIFAWLLSEKIPWNLTKSFNILASSPENFPPTWKLFAFRPVTPRLPYTMTNKGLQITTVILPAADYATSKRVYIPLCCAVEGENLPLAMRLICTQPGEYEREIGTLDLTTWLQWPQDSELDIQSGYTTETIHITGSIYVHGGQGKKRSEDEIHGKKAKSLRDAFERFSRLGSGCSSQASESDDTASE